MLAKFRQVHQHITSISQNTRETDEAFDCLQILFQLRLQSPEILPERPDPDWGPDNRGLSEYHLYPGDDLSKPSANPLVSVSRLVIPGYRREIYATSVEFRRL